MKNETKLKIFISVIFTVVYLISFSQKAPAKFGKISVDELKNELCPIDSNAHAYYIFDYGRSYFQYADTKVSSDDVRSSRKGFQLFFKRHFRIKIIDNQAFSRADFEIPLYRDGDEEKIIKIRAVTYNLEKNKVVKTKLEKKDVYTEETSKNRITKKFAMPAVREGSIIEIEYTIKSDFYFNLRQWCFQQTIPVLQSEYHVSIPEYFNFNQIQKGYFPIRKERDSRPKSITITYTQKAGGIGVQEQTYTNTYDYKENIYNYYATNIPAFLIEDYLRTKENYITKMEFELHDTKFPNSTLKYFTTSWEKINENLLNDFQFGMELNKTSHITEDAEHLKRLKQKDIILINSAFQLIKDKLVWNGYNSKYPSTSLRKAYKSGVGNSADINLNLIILLRELGFDAYPVILSTRENGVISADRPSISRFNYVIAMAKVNNDIVLMDATDPYSEINLLPLRCLNDKGRVVNNTNGDWITLMDYKEYSKVETYDYEIFDNLEIKGTNQIKLKDYAAYLNRKEIKKYNNINEYKESIEKQTKDYKINEFNISGLDTIQDEMKISLNFSQNNFAEQSDDMIFFMPVYNPDILENPFKLDKRNYPVEFNYPLTIQQIYTISIPGNYTVAELPKPFMARTPDGKMKYYYSINQLGEKITISIAFIRSKTLFLPEEYQGLKEFYQMVIDKQKELIVLKKAQ